MPNKYSDLGFKEETNSDLGFMEDHSDVGFVPEEGSKFQNDLEIKLQQAKDAAIAAQQKVESVNAVIEAAKHDPRNWTVKQTEDHFKANPPQNPQEEAQATALLDEKKKQRDMAADSIRQAPPKSLLDTVKEVLSKPFTQTSEQKKAHAQNIFALAHIFNAPPQEVEKNYDAFQSKIIKRDPTATELASTMVVGPIAAGLISNPVATGVGLVAFQGIAEVENALASRMKHESYQFMRGREFKDALPEEANAVTKDMLGLVEFVAKGLGAAGLTKGSSVIAERFAKDLLVYNKLPKTMYLPTASGEDVQVPTEKVVKLAMGENWDSVKSELSVAPTPKEAVKAKKEAHADALVQQAKKDVSFVEEAPEGTQDAIVPPEAIGTQKKATAEAPADKYYADFLSKGSETGKPSQYKRGTMPEGTGANEPSVNLKAEKVSPDSSTRYVEPSISKNFDSITNLHEKSTILRNDSQANIEPFKKDIQDATGLIPDVRIKSMDRLVDKIANYQRDGRSGRDVSDVLGARVVSEDPQSHVAQIKQKFQVLETRDYFKTPNQWGYTGINNKVKLPNGQLAEIQLHTPESVAKSTAIHKLYERWSAKSKNEMENLTPQEGRSLAADLAEARRIAGLSKDDFYGEFGKKPPVQPPAAETPPAGLKERKFITSVRDADKTAPEVASKVQGEYQPISNEQTLAEAKHVLETDPEAAQAAVEGPGRPTRVTNTIAQLLIDQAQNSGRYEDAIRLVETTARKNTEMGQTIQALSMYSRLTPEGILRFAAKQLDVAGVKIDPKLGEELVTRAKKLKDMPEGRDRDIETALILKEIAKRVPSNVLQKISMVQTLAQLLNPKTMIRNLLGNVVFMGTENIAQTVGTALDVATSLVTGKRTLFMPDPLTQIKGLAQGLREGTQEALQGINLKKTGSKFDLPQNSIFNKGVMAALEKTLSVALGATDRAFYQAAFNDSIRSQMRAAKVGEPSAEMVERAHYDGLYRTFQDDNVVSRVFVDLKKTLNAGKDFGMGDIIIKYPRTPAALLHRGIEYSPFGFISTVLEIGKPLFGKPFNQAQFVQSTARALTGTTLLIGTGAVLGNLGIITGRRSTDKDVSAAQKQVGIREYQINVDALKRFIASGFNAQQAQLQKGDTLISYDWMQPSSIGLAMGANMFLDPARNVTQKALDLASNVGNHLLKAFETLEGQPLVQGLKTLSGRQSLAEGIAASIEGIPASFVPTLLNQIRQLTDNVSRNTKDPNYFREVENKAANKIPGVSPSLPARLTPLGKPQEMYQAGTNNPFNVFLNPAFVAKYNPDPISDMVLGIWERSGNTAQFPRVVSAKIKVGKENMELTPEQYTQFSSYVGHKTDVLFGLLANNPAWMATGAGAISDDVKAKKLQGMLSDINTAAKIEVLGYRPQKVHNDVTTILKSIARDTVKIKRNDDKTTIDFRSETE